MTYDIRRSDVGRDAAIFLSRVSFHCNCTLTYDFITRIVSFRVATLTPPGSIILRCFLRVAYLVRSLPPPI